MWTRGAFSAFISTSQATSDTKNMKFQSLSTSDKELFVIFLAFFYCPVMALFGAWTVHVFHAALTTPIL